jgi:2'-5' RNA ligase
MFRDIEEALEEVRMAPFSMRIKGLGFFPPRGAPRVLWAGIEKNQQLLLIRNKVESCLVRIGLEPEGRKFSPHITIARLKGTPANKIGNFLAGNGLFETASFTVQEFLLYSSRLNDKCAIHTIEAAYELGETEGDEGEPS